MEPGVACRVDFFAAQSSGHSECCIHPLSVLPGVLYDGLCPGLRSPGCGEPQRTGKHLQRDVDFSVSPALVLLNSRLLSCCDSAASF